MGIKLLAVNKLLASSRDEGRPQKSGKSLFFLTKKVIKKKLLFTCKQSYRPHYIVIIPFHDKNFSYRNIDRIVV